MREMSGTPASRAWNVSGRLTPCCVSGNLTDMMNTDLTVGQTVQWTNRKGDVRTGEIVVTYLHGEYTCPKVRVKFFDSPIPGTERNLPVDELTLGGTKPEELWF